MSWRNMKQIQEVGDIRRGRGGSLRRGRAVAVGGRRLGRIGHRNPAKLLGLAEGNGIPLSWQQEIRPQLGERSAVNFREVYFQ